MLAWPGIGCSGAMISEGKVPRSLRGEPTCSHQNRLDVLISALVLYGLDVRLYSLKVDHAAFHSSPCPSLSEAAGAPDCTEGAHSALKIFPFQSNGLLLLVTDGT